MKSTFPIDSAEIEVTFEWDNGDHSVNIGAGWGESTGVVIKAGPVWTFVAFEIENDIVPELWRIREVQVNEAEVGEDGSTKHLHGLAWVEYKGDDGQRLGDFPMICKAVRETWEQVQAQEAIERTREDCWGYEGAIIEYEDLLDPEHGVGPDHPRRPEYEAELAKARYDLEGAKAMLDQLRVAYAEKYGASV